MALLRLVHIVSGVFRVGTMLFVAGFLQPAVAAAGPDGGRVMQRLATATRFPTAVGAAAGLSQDLWRAGHAHAGVLLVLSLVALRYVDEARLSDRMKDVVRSTIPLAAILLPVAFFLSVPSPRATAPNGLIYLAPLVAVSLTVGLVTLGVGLLRR
jgi:hypothetical protein